MGYPPRGVTRATNIGEQDGLFVGRGAALEIVSAAVRAHRLVTLTGTAGVGKTTLATRCAVAALAAHPGGVWLCDLTEATTAEDVCRCVARALAVPLVSARGEDTAAQVGAALAGLGRALIVLDNMEQLVDHAGATVGAWLAAARGARFLVTSRERLRVRDEVVIEVAPLEGDDAVALFVARAQAAGSGGVLRDEDGPVIAEIVRRLDGVPLAITLAAARVGALGPAQILARLAGRFELLDGGSPRGRTLRDAIGVSWELLSPWERAALAQCSVFRGGFSLDAAGEVVSLSGFAGAPSILDVIEALRDKSLLRTQRVGDEIRYGLYASTGEFAASTLGRADAEAVEGRHAAFYTRAAVAWSERVSRAGGGAVMALLLREIDNVQAAVARCLDPGAAPGTVTLGIEALVALDAAFSVHGWSPAFLALLDRAVAPPGEGRVPARHLIEAHRVRGKVRCAEGRTADAERDLGRAIELAVAEGDRRLEGRARAVLGLVYRILGRTDDAQAQYERALEQADPGDLAGVGEVWLKLGNLDFDRGRVDAARAAYERALPLLVATGDLRRTGHTLGNLGNLHARAGQDEEAKSSYLRAIEIAHDLADRWAEEVFHGNLAQLFQRRGDFAEAHRRYERAIAGLRAAGHRRGAANLQMDWGTLFHEEGRVDEALARYREAAVLLREVGNRRVEGLALAYATSAEAELGRVDRAEAGYAAAEALLTAADDRMGLVAVRLQRAYFDLLTGRATAADDRIAAARQLPAQSADLRFCLRLIDRALRSREAERLRVGPGARWFEGPGAPRADLAGRDALRRILLRLADAHAARPGEPLSSADLLSSGWPDERVLARAGANRVRVALSTLRKLGLRSALVSRPDGWMLDPALTVTREAGR